MIYKLLSTRVYRSYYGGKNIDYVTGVENPDVTRFPEDWLASVVTAFNPDRPIENEGLSKTTEGRFLKDIIEEKKEEERRLAYVAFTRAQKGLYLSSSGGFDFCDCEKEPSRFISDVDKGLLKNIG